MPRVSIKIWSIAAVIALVVGAGAAWATTAIVSAVTPDAVCNAQRVADDVLPTVVTIDVSGPGGSGNGTGEIIRDTGYILTNSHVIVAAATGGSITVTFSNGHTVLATLVGRDARNDIAVIKADAEAKLPVIDQGDSERLAVGQPVVALGAPLGLSSTVTAGIVSALGRNVPVPVDDTRTTVLTGAIQTDAAINPGNSGGPLVDCSGRLIGINTAIATVPNETGANGGGSVGIGFAVPVDLAMRLADELIEHGSIAYPSLDVQVVPVPPAVARAWDIPHGLFVQSAGGAAASAGLKAGDVILSIDGRAMDTTDALALLLITKTAGDDVEITYLRDGERRTVTATLTATDSAG
ncbi:trypsin-like peptidase domain-containing protein [Microbacterium horticulturae]|uniref:Trypsin-like peptidase domain-containing protein n=1 Tax=Microbacterium horticulturae TaxID=3028316 RepID=A0ABY8BZS5_9MICO|nr:trypsin-like peptidase domain-containing protein [Microbacterium sp. KACC 23027]WEG09701.1 trypsin-like peptidase domain-containing protein [Microbacterium sp. KACC 23027]